MIGETGERKSAVATPDGKSRKKKKMTANVRTVGTAKDHCSVYITLNLNIIKYPAIHTNYIISHATTLPYNHII